MNDEQRRVKFFSLQPAGLGLFFSPTSLSVIQIGMLLYTPDASLEKKIASSSGKDESSTAPK